MISQNGTNGRVYGGDPALVHIQDGQRTFVGRYVANQLEHYMRAAAAAARKPEQDMDPWTLPLCAGCYMVAIFNASVFLAKDSGQSLSELGRTMSAAFAALIDYPDGDPDCIESINVMLDPEEPS
jgi:hypothetical protein